jgi:hypothetical protein
MEALYTISGFLGGALLTSLWYSFGLARQGDRTATQLADHLKSPPVCPLHQQLQSDLREAERNMERR